jgi:hypothetical protein
MRFVRSRHEAPKHSHIALQSYGLYLQSAGLTNQVIQNPKDTFVAFRIQDNNFFSRIQEAASMNSEFFNPWGILLEGCHRKQP